jgi:hypothetical protein
MLVVVPQMVVRLAAVKRARHGVLSSLMRC